MKTILIVDDDRAITKRNEAALTLAFGENVKILVAYSAEKVLELASEYRIDVFIIDILGIAKDIDGIELAEILRKEGYPYPVPIIIASQEGDATYKSEVHKRIKFYDYITKPYEPGELVSQVESATEDMEYRPNPYFEIKEELHTYRTIRNQISHIEKVTDKRRIAINRRDEDGKLLRTAFVPIESFKSFVEESVEADFDLIQCERTIVVNLYWVERYCEEENCIVLRICGTKLLVGKKFRKKIKKLVPIY